MRDDPDDLVLKSLPKDVQKVILKRGASATDMLFTNDRLNVTRALTNMEVDIPRVAQKTIGIRTQTRALTKILERPLSGSYVVGIGSFPTDQYAKWLASEIFARGLAQWKLRHRAGRALPLWHRVYGSYRDPLRDDPVTEIPSLLVISNVVQDSTGVKVEKVRDLLEKFSNIPRIVVTGGQDPATFFATRLHYPLDAAIYLGPMNRIED